MDGLGLIIEYIAIMANFEPYNDHIPNVFRFDRISRSQWTVSSLFCSSALRLSWVNFECIAYIHIDLNTFKYVRKMGNSMVLNYSWRDLFCLYAINCYFSYS